MLLMYNRTTANSENLICVLLEYRVTCCTNTHYLYTLLDRNQDHTGYLLRYHYATVYHHTIWVTKFHICVLV